MKVSIFLKADTSRPLYSPFRPVLMSKHYVMKT